MIPHHEPSAPDSASASDSAVSMRVPGRDVVIDCGWGRLIFGQTFSTNSKIAKILCEEANQKRDIAFYLRDPHVVISLAPHEIFLDPSHTYRLWLERYRPAQREMTRGFKIRFIENEADAEAMAELYVKRHMIPPEPSFIWQQHKTRELTYLLAEDEQSGKILGAVFGVDHYEVFADPENGSSLWALVVDPQAPYSGIGETLVRSLAEYYLARGRSFMDLSVMHDNEQAIALYEKLGFHRVVVFALKHKNPYNEPLFIAPPPEAKLNPYAAIIVKEARRRGISMEVLDEQANYFSLSFGGRTVLCRESLTELTTAVAMSICDDKSVTRRVLLNSGLRVPQQMSVPADDDEQFEPSVAKFLADYKRVVVKPARGEQGAGISVDLHALDEVKAAITWARTVYDNVLLEEYVQGEDLRIVVIDFKVAAAATRRPATIIGTGHDKIIDLIEKQSRRRSAATGGESHIPIDAETQRCVQSAGYQLDSVLPEGDSLTVRKTANLHTGGTIHDVTHQLSPALKQAAIAAASAINIPVVGFDFLVPDLKGDEYVIIEANERPGLANHEPQPLVERFVDLLFPQTVAR